MMKRENRFLFDIIIENKSCLFINSRINISIKFFAEIVFRQKTYNDLFL